MGWLTDLTTALLKRLEYQHVLILVIVALVVITGLLVWGALQNREVSLFWGAVKLSPLKVSIGPEIIEKTQSLLEAANAQLEALREDVIAEIQGFLKEERRLSEKLIDPYILPTQKHLTASLIDKATKDRRGLEQQFVTRLDALKDDCRQIAKLLDKTNDNKK